MLFQDKTYMVLMVDPDAPNHVIGEFYLHWLVMNIPVSWVLGGIKVVVIYYLIDNETRFGCRGTF